MQDTATENCQDATGHFFPILLISLNFTTIQIKVSPHAIDPKQSSDF